MTQASHVLLSHLQSAAKRFCGNEETDGAPEPFAVADPWLLASCVQKAIRRDEFVLARRAAHHLLRLDPQRLWRRLLTIGLEDIGIGDIEVAAELVGLASFPQTRRLFGGTEKALDFAIGRACAAVKDRTADQLASVARARVSKGAIGDPRDLQSVLGSAVLPWHRRLAAGCALSPTGEDDARQRAAKFDFLVETFGGLGAPELLLAACQTYARKSRDGLASFVLLAFDLQQGQDSFIASLVPPSVQIGGWPAYVFDPIRTRLGRRAVDLWLRSYLQRPPFDGGQVSAALWDWESGACRRLLHWPLGEVIAQEARCADLQARGLALCRHGEILQWVIAEQSVLLCAREAVWQGVLRTLPPSSTTEPEPGSGPPPPSGVAPALEEPFLAQELGR